jgi:hypothetical protein
MRRFLPFALPLILVACSDDPVANEATPRAVSSSSAATAVDGHVAPKPGALRTFGNWAVGCDNGATCKAAALIDEEADPSGVLMSVERGAGPAGAITLRFQHDGPIALPMSVGVDGEAVVRGGTVDGEWTVLTGQPAEVLTRRLAGGETLGVADATGAEVGTVSLTGAAAALRWIDAQQGRAGTTGAIVARGGKADTRPAPALPVVQAPAIRGEAALLDPQVVVAMRRQGQCDSNGLPEATTAPLGGGRTLALIPCVVGAYNILSVVAVVERGEATAANFDVPVQAEVAGGMPVVVNGGFADGVLRSDAKGRGIGDCGIAQKFAWDGKGFRLIERREMEECRGNTDLIRTWVARVVQ